MKTIGTITFHNSINYGAILQTYALQKILCDMGHHADIIDYCNPKRGVALTGFRHGLNLVWHGVLKKILAGSGRQKKTEAFRLKYLRLSARKYTDTQTLHSDPPLYDAYITGSDQVWNPRIINHDSSYFLTFAPQGKKRISYAASFGVAHIRESLVADYEAWLKQIQYLSTREFEGKKLIEQLTGRNAEVTLDPTLLLDQAQWRRIAVPYEISKSYILCYNMLDDKKINKSINKIAHKVSTQTGWEVIWIGQKEYMRMNFLKKSLFNAGPAEFLGLFQNASFVVTDSFHGTAFSVNYKKPFITLINHGVPPERAIGTRITTLLKTLHLENRLFPAGGTFSSENALDMCYQHTELILQQEKERSIDFLRNALREL